MKRIYMLLILLTATGSHSVLAQSNAPITKGTIQYEKRINKYAIEKEMLEGRPNANDILDDYQKHNAQFQTLQFNLYFNNDNCLYKPDAAPITGSDFLNQSTTKNIVATDLKAGDFVSQKNIFNETFLVKDSLRKIQWKITSETRQIAGYECRRANAIILDSVYVVAFYTVDIVPKGGPELFNGLPGMILGISLPHEHITWFATNVSYQLPYGIMKEQSTFGKETTLTKLKNDIGSSFKRETPKAINVIIKNVLF